VNLRLKGGQSDPRQDMRHVDTIWPLWNLFDVTPDGRLTPGIRSWPTDSPDADADDLVISA